MERKVIVVDEINIKTTLDKYHLFEYKLEGQKDLSKGKKEFVFTRDNSVPYYDELVKLENTYPNYHYPKMIYTIIFSILAFLIVTGLLITFFINKAFAKSYWWIFIIPTSICLLITVYFTYRRIDIMKKIEMDKPRIDKEYKEKIENLKK